MNTEDSRQIITCQQALASDGSVFSIQATDLPEQYAATLTPQFILDEYLVYLRRFTLSLARPVWTEHGLEFRFMSTRMHILRFAAPACAEKGKERGVTLRICGGPFVQGDQCNRGKFSFIAEDIDGGVKVTVELTDYFPRLLGSSAPSIFRKWLYRFTQAALHRFMTTRFLAFLHRKLTGQVIRFRIIRIHELAGEDI